MTITPSLGSVRDQVILPTGVIAMQSPNLPAASMHISIAQKSATDVLKILWSSGHDNLFQAFGSHYNEHDDVMMSQGVPQMIYHPLLIA